MYGLNTQGRTEDSLAYEQKRRASVIAAAAGDVQSASEIGAELQLLHEALETHGSLITALRQKLESVSVMDTANKCGGEQAAGPLTCLVSTSISSARHTVNFQSEILREQLQALRC